MIETLIAWGAFLLFFLCAWHFAVDGIFIPSMRDMFRLRIFNLRDQLRLLHLTQPETVDAQSYRALEDSMNNAIQVLDDFTFIYWKRLRDYRIKNDSLRKRNRKRLDMMNACDDSEFQEIRTRLNNDMDTLLYLNSFGWAIYIVPIAISFALMSRTRAFVEQSFIPLSQSDFRSISKAVPV